MEQINKKSKTGWYILGLIILALACMKFIMFFQYPSDKTNFDKLFLNKYWKASADLKLKALNIDGEQLRNPNQEVDKEWVKTIVDKVENRVYGETDWIDFENGLKKANANDFFLAKKTDENGYIIYEQCFDVEINSNLYNLSYNNFSFADSRFSLNLNNVKLPYYLVGDDMLNVVDSVNYENFILSIISISDDELYVEVKATYPPDDVDPIRVEYIYNVTYKKFQPQTEFVNFANKSFTLFKNN
jgi:hypothetical protein